MIPNELRVEGDTFRLAFFGDHHINSHACSYRNLSAAVEYIRMNPDMYWVGMGDHIEGITHRDPRFDPNNMKVEFMIEQLDHAVEILEPIKTQCIGVHGGNHEETIMKLGLLEPVKYLCKKLGTKNLGYGEAWHKITLVNNGKHSRCIKVYTAHGRIYSQKEGTMLNRLVDLINRFHDIDALALGHSHHLIAQTTPTIGQTTKGKHTMIAKQRHVFATGSFFKTREIGGESYAEKRGGNPLPLGFPILEVTLQPYKIRHDIIEYVAEPTEAACV